MKILIESEYFLNYAFDSATGTTIKNVSLKTMRKFPIPLPPLAEQRRIVQKVNSLFQKIDALAQHSQAAQTTRQRLRKALLQRLDNATTNKALQQTWQNLSPQFETVFDSVEGIKALRKSILQLAVKGKLVPQNSGDEPATVLLERIKVEKERLVREKVIKKGKVLPAISEEEMPFELPEGWTWCRMGSLCEIGTGATPTSSNPAYYSGNIPWVTSTLTGLDFIEKTEKHITPLAIKKSNCTIYPKKSLVIAMYGQGKTRGQISELLIDAATNQACAVIVFRYFYESNFKDYIKLVFKKQYDEIRTLAEGGAQPNLNLSKIKNNLIPLPPIAEQKRIVQKVSQMMERCHELEEQITKRMAVKERLLSKALAIN